MKTFSFTFIQHKHIFIENSESDNNISALILPSFFDLVAVTRIIATQFVAILSNISKKGV